MRARKSPQTTLRAIGGKTIIRYIGETGEHPAIWIGGARCGGQPTKDSLKWFLWRSLERLTGQRVMLSDEPTWE